jgi:DNA-binding transcriptional ArsR family regulator
VTEHQKDNNPKKDSYLINFRRNTEIFHGDQNLYLVWKRIQNIVAALFLITSTWQEEDLKSSLRSTSLSMLTASSSLIALATINESHIRQLTRFTLELDSLVAVGFWAGIISEMNTLVLQKEIEKIEKDLHTLIQAYKNKYLISSALFKDVEDIELHAKEFVKGHNKGQDIKDRVKDKFQVLSQKSSIPFSDNRSERRQAILKLLGEKGNLSIKDFSTVISSYSEKTIQRELLALVAEGLVKRHGERRWSTYTLSD